VRKLINEKPGARAVFRFTGKKDKKKKKKKKDDDDSDDEENKQQVPRMYVDFKGETDNSSFSDCNEAFLFRYMYMYM
jgi:hypothetical protein